jgi:deazaflavin-dependent oxidoreductase (nitroreductase family)
MYVIMTIAIIVAAALVFVLLTLGVLVLKAAHRRPGDGVDHAHGPLERSALRILTVLIRAGLRVGIRIGPMVMLTIPGRKTGVNRTNPVDLWVEDDRRYLVATHDQTAAWVRNLRAAGHGVVWYGRKRWAFTATELARDEAGVVIKRVIGPRLRRPVAGLVLRQTLGVPHDASLADFVAAAATHPVFALTVTSGPSLRTTADADPSALIAGQQSGRDTSGEATGTVGHP